MVSRFRHTRRVQRLARHCALLMGSSRRRRRQRSASFVLVVAAPPYAGLIAPERGSVEPACSPAALPAGPRYTAVNATS